ncbi:MAG: RidA family protein [Woeseiales bacterium]
MLRENISIPNVAEPADARAGSQCIRDGNQLFISGQIAYDNGKLVGLGDALEQCRQCFRHIDAFVTAAGGSMDDVVSLNIFLSDIRFRQASFDARAEVFNAPGRVDFAFDDLLVEISAIATLK